jgi:3-oxoadipate enol-lactonase
LLSSPGHLVCCWGQYAKISFGVSIQRSAAHVTSARREGLGLMEAQLNGIRLVWDEVGRASTAPPLLLVHGFPLNRTMWRPQLAALAASTRVIAPDLRGHGASDAPPGPYLMDDFAADLQALLDHLGLARVIYCGLSMGGYIGFAFVRRYPARLAGLMLADTRAGADTEEGRANREDLAQLVEREGSAATVDRLLPRYVAPRTHATQPELVAGVRAMIAGTPPAGLAGAARGMGRRPDSFATLGEIAVPTAIVVGSEDALTPPAEAERLHTAIAGSTLTIIPDAGHLSNLEQPAAFNEAVRRFLALAS